MRLGLVHVNMGSMSQPDALAKAAREAETAGFDSVWAGEHVVLPDPQVPPSPMHPQDPALDPLLALAWAAAPGGSRPQGERAAAATGQAPVPAEPLSQAGQFGGVPSACWPACGLPMAPDPGPAVLTISASASLCFPCAFADGGRDPAGRLRAARPGRRQAA